MNKRFTILLMAVMAVGCIQDPEAPNNLPDLPTLSVDETSVTRVSMVLGGSFGSNMTDITAYGVEISETLFESGGTYKTLVPQEMGADGFSLGVSDLKSNSTYFLRAFISNGHSRMYSTTLTQKTPETSVASISDVTLKDDYYLVATIEDNGGRSIEDVGFMWSTSAERKDIKREKRYPATLSGDGKTFTLPVNEVGEGTHYIMAYAEDDKDGTGYSRIPYEWVVTSDQGVAIEDPNFKKYLLMYHDGNEDGKMSYAEMEAIESIDVHTDNIKTVREINMMSRLHSLIVSGTQQGSGQLTSLDMSKNTGLSAVDCSNNKLRQLDASSISGLVYLNCDGNPMDTLFLSYYQKFEELRYPKETVVVYVDAPPVDPNVQPDNEIWYTSTDGNVVDPYNTEAFENNAIVSNTYEDGKGIIRFENRLETIGMSAFSSGKFKTVDLPEGLKTIERYAFSYCSQMTSITFPSTLESIGYHAIRDCYALTSVTIPESVTFIDGGAFSACYSVTSYKGKFATSDGRCLIDNGRLIAAAPGGLTSFTIPSGVTSIGDYAFSGFRSLSSVTIPSGVATICNGAFSYCSALTTIAIPESVTTVEQGAFSHCPALQSFDSYLATEDRRCLIVNGYLVAFAPAGLTEYSIPEGVADIGYSAFSSCTSLTSVTIPSTTKTIGSYAFNHCSSLTAIWVLATTPPSLDRLQVFDDTNNCPIYVPRASVDTYKAANNWSTYADRIQANPNDFSASKYLTFTSEGTTKISLANEAGNAPVLYYSTDASNWTQWDYSELTFTQGNPLYICGNNPDGFSHGDDQYSVFSASGSKFAVSGDIMSLLNKDTDVSRIPIYACFKNLFYNCTGLTSAPALPATELSVSCYRSMFEGCTSLVSAPSLPATSLTRYCYLTMFKGCTSLTTAPVLSATTLIESCYSGMFQGCSSLVSAPALPATSMVEECYRSMFQDCTKLATAPELPATSLAYMCYSDMFQGCTSLTSAPVLPAVTLANNCYSWMFYGCSSLTEVPDLPATELGDFCCFRMFMACSSLVTAPALPATTLAKGCYADMFWHCSSLTAAPDLPATLLVERCYENMFADCYSLASIKCLATDITADSCVAFWTQAVASTGTFVKAANTDWPTGSSGIPSGWTVVNDGETPNGGHEGTGEEEWN